MKKLLSTILILISLVLLYGCVEDPKDPPNPDVLMYQNPVWEPILADPAIIRHDGKFYAYGTQDYGQWSESEFGTRYTPILVSEDLVNWTYGGSVFQMNTRPTWGSLNAGLWAPDIVKIGEKFLLYYSLSVWGDSNPGIGVASSNHPLGPWTDHGELLRSESIGVNNSIDPAVFEAEGKVYMIWGSFRGIYGIELSSDGLSLKNPLTAKDDKIHLAGFETSSGFNLSTYEGAYIIFKDNYYYMFVSLGSCCDGHNSSYQVRVARSSSPMGPYVDHNNQSMKDANRGRQVLIGNAYFSGPGHNAVIQDDEGNYFIIYHGYDRSEDPFYGNSPRRSLLLDKLLWDEDGFPYVRGMMPSNTPQPYPVIRNNKE